MSDRPNQREVDPSHARERAAVTWWIGVNKPHLAPTGPAACRLFESILKERGAQLSQCVADYETHLENQERNGVSTDATEKPLESLVPLPKPIQIRHKPRNQDTALDRFHARPRSKPKPTPQPEPPIEPGPSSPPSNAAPAPEPAPPEQNGKTLGEVWSRIAPEKPAVRVPPLPSTLSLKELVAFSNGVKVVTEALMLVEPKLATLVLDFVRDAQRATL